MSQNELLHQHNSVEPLFFHHFMLYLFVSLNFSRTFFVTTSSVSSHSFQSSFFAFHAFFPLSISMATLSFYSCRCFVIFYLCLCARSFFVRAIIYVLFVNLISNQCSHKKSAFSAYELKKKPHIHTISHGLIIGEYKWRTQKASNLHERHRM